MGKWGGEGIRGRGLPRGPHAVAVSPAYILCNACNVA